MGEWIEHLDKYIGISSDTKPILAVRNATRFFEVDTGIEYIFYNAVWYNNTVKTGVESSAARDAFNRLRVSDTYTIYDIKQNTSNQPLFFDDQEVSGSGTASTYNTNKASTSISVSAATAGKRVRQTKMWSQYQPGRSQLIFISFNLRGNVEGVIKRAGLFNENFGFFIELDGSTANVVIRTYNTGSAVDTSIAQSSWNLDKLDGTGQSGITIDWSLSQLLVFDFEWLGVGRVRFGFRINGSTYYVHEFLHANINEEVYMSNPNAPIRFEIENDGTGAATEIETMCCSVQSEGGQLENAITTYVSRDGTPITLANQDLFTPILSIRQKPTRPCTRVKILDISVLLTTNSNFEWSVFLNPTIGGVDAVDWVDVTNSAIQYDISRDATNVVAAGLRVDGGYGSSSNQSKITSTGSTDSFLTIGSNIDGTGDEYVLAVKNIDANGGTCYGGMTASEYC